jgi:hypothetical protein
MKAVIERTLNLLPEVIWDRFIGDLKDEELGIGVYGWLEREDGKSDFVFVRICVTGAWMFTTSSARYSQEFAIRLKLCSPDKHQNCQRVEHFFNVKSIQL